MLGSSGCFHTISAFVQSALSGLWLRVWGLRGVRVQKFGQRRQAALQIGERGLASGMNICQDQGFSNISEALVLEIGF